MGEGGRSAGGQAMWGTCSNQGNTEAVGAAPAMCLQPLTTFTLNSWGLSGVSVFPKSLAGALAPGQAAQEERKAIFQCLPSLGQKTHPCSVGPQRTEPGPRWAAWRRWAVIPNEDPHSGSSRVDSSAGGSGGAGSSSGQPFPSLAMCHYSCV